MLPSDILRRSSIDRTFDALLTRNNYQQFVDFACHVYLFVV